MPNTKSYFTPPKIKFRNCSHCTSYWQYISVNLSYFSHRKQLSSPELGQYESLPPSPHKHGLAMFGQLMRREEEREKVISPH